jgi:hypothetical protein
VPAISESKYLVSAGWDDAVHLGANEKRKMLAETPHHLRDARSKGIPSLGQGAIYPIAESEFVVPPMKIPSHWTRGYGMDVGWNRTAAAFLAHDRDQDIVYVTSEHYRGQAEPSTHATAIRARGEWLPGFIDPAANGRGQKDGEQLMVTYISLGLHLSKADNGVEAGIVDVMLRLATGRLKVFATCVNLLAEYRIYRRNKLGAIVKANDHLMDALRYGVRPTSLVGFTIPPVSMLVGQSTPNLYR